MSGDRFYEGRRLYFCEDCKAVKHQVHLYGFQASLDSPLTVLCQNCLLHRVQQDILAKLPGAPDAEKDPEQALLEEQAERWEKS